MAKITLPLLSLLLEDGGAKHWAEKIFPSEKHLRRKMIRIQIMKRQKAPQKKNDKNADCEKAKMYRQWAGGTQAGLLVPVGWAHRREPPSPDSVSRLHPMLWLWQGGLPETWSERKRMFKLYYIKWYFHFPQQVDLPSTRSKLCLPPFTKQKPEICILVLLWSRQLKPKLLSHECWADVNSSPSAGFKEFTLASQKWERKS